MLAPRALNTTKNPVNFCSTYLSPVPYFSPVPNRGIMMERKKYVFGQGNDMWLGYLDEYPDYMTQGVTLEKLKENLMDI